MLVPLCDYYKIVIVNYTYTNNNTETDTNPQKIPHSQLTRVTSNCFSGLTELWKSVFCLILTCANMKSNKSLTGDATNKHCPLMEAHALGVISLSQFRTANHTVFSSGCNVNDHSFSLVLPAQWGLAKLTLWMRAHSDIMPTRMCVFIYTCTHTYHNLTLGLKTHKSKAWRWITFSTQI